MIYHIKKFPRSEVEISVALSSDEFEPHVKRAAVLLAEEHDIEGFRRGKAPYEMVKNKFGEAVLYERAAELVVRKTYPEVLDGLEKEGALSQETPPIGKPDIMITKLAPGNDFSYTAKTALLPQVTLPDYRAIARRVLEEKREAHVEDAEVENALLWLQESRATRVTVVRPVAAGDTAEVDFTIRENGVKIAGGDSRNHPIAIGKGKFLPGFEEALIGMKEGEEKNFSLVVPLDWHEQSLAGKTLDIAIAVKRVEEQQLPAFDDAFAENVGNFSSLDALKESIKTGITQEKAEKEKERVRMAIIDAVAKEIAMEIPDILIASELKKMFMELESGVSRMGMKFEDYLRHIKKNPEDLEKEWHDQAEHRVRVALCLREIARKESIEPSREEIEARANEFLQGFKSTEDAEKTIDPGELYEYSKGVVRNEKVFEFLERA